MTRFFSLKFFFNRQGIVVRRVLLLGWILTVFEIFRLVQGRAVSSKGSLIAYGVFIALALAITLTRLIPWYVAADRGHGIEEHFQKTLVPVAYLLVIVNAFMIAGITPWPLLILGGLFFIAVQSVNGILIYLHKRDKDTTPPSFFSRPDSSAH